MNKLLSIFLLAFGSIAYGPAIYAEDIQTADGVHWRVFQAGLPRVDNLGLSPTGRLFATLEQGNGEGRLVSIHLGQVKTLLENLDRPDGLALDGNTLYVTEEVRQGRVLKFDIGSGKTETLVTLDNPEGIVVLPDKSLLLTEDTRNGRLLQLSSDGKLTVLATGLFRPEGLRRASDGSIYIAETGCGRIVVYRNGKLHTAVERLVEPDQLVFDSEGNLWISEDAGPGRILRLRDGRTDVMISGLASPQGMVFDKRGRLYVAEQGRNRILLFTFPGRK